MPNTAKFYCVCCPNAVCGCCIGEVEFAPVKGKKGFCDNCLELLLLAEQNADYDSDGVCIGILQLPLESSGSLIIAICSIPIPPGCYLTTVLICLCAFCFLSF